MAAEIQCDSDVESPDQMADASKTPATRLRVLHVVPRLGLGGTEHGVLKVLNGLGDQQFEHQICAVRGVDAKFAENMHLSVRTHSVGTSQPGFQFPLFRLMGVMKEFRPHVVHSRNFGALEAILAARLSRVPVVVHSEHGYELEILNGLPLRRRILCRGLFPMADAVFAVTGELRDFHSRESWVPKDRIRVIPNGVSIERFGLRGGDIASFRNRLGIPPGRFVIGSVGRLVPIKDHRTLLQAVESMLPERKDLHVLLVGDGPERAKLEEYASHSAELRGHVTFTGASDSVPELMASMQVFVLPSISEGMSNTVLEAMASGLPLVVTRAGGNPELVPDGTAGFLFSPGDVRGLAERLALFADRPDLCVRFGRDARQRAVEVFSLSGMIKNYRDLYLELARKRNVLNPE